MSHLENRLELKLDKMLREAEDSRQQLRSPNEETQLPRGETDHCLLKKQNEHFKARVKELEDNARTRAKVQLKEALEKMLS